MAIRPSPPVESDISFHYNSVKLHASTKKGVQTQFEKTSLTLRLRWNHNTQSFKTIKIPVWPYLRVTVE